MPKLSSHHVKAILFLFILIVPLVLWCVDRFSGSSQKSSPDLIARTPMEALLTLVNEQSDAQDRKANPNETSPRLRHFGMELAPMMDEAIKNDEKAAAFWTDLEVCCRSNEIAIEARALCAANAKRLSVHDVAKFGPRFAELREALPKELVRFIDQIKR